MIIGVDAGVLGGKDKNLQAGVYIVAVNLFQELKKIDSRNQYIFYSFKPINQKLLQSFPMNSINVVLPSKAWLYFSLPLAFLKRKPDVFLAVSQAIPVIHPFKTIGFIHGLDFISVFHNERTKRMENNTTFLLKNSSTIITTSEFLKKEITQKYNINNTQVIPLGINKVFSKNYPHKVGNSYFLFVGTLKISKNIPIILKSFAAFKKNIKEKYILLIVGSDFWLDKEIQQTILKLKLENYISIIPPVDPKKLAELYQGATALISPSLYEGFGLPLVEAMAAGCPVIASTAGAIPEVVGDAALLADPMDYKKIAKYMEMVATDKKLRRELIRKGRKQAKKYSWEKFARQVLDIIESL